jgi:hypothetical protein
MRRHGRQATRAKPEEKETEMETKAKRCFLCDDKGDRFWLHAKISRLVSPPPSSPALSFPAPLFHPQLPYRHKLLLPQPPRPFPFRTISAFTAADHPHNKVSKPMRRREGVGVRLRLSQQRARRNGGERIG